LVAISILVLLPFLLAAPLVFATNEGVHNISHLAGKELVHELDTRELLLEVFELFPSSVSFRVPSPLHQEFPHTFSVVFAAPFHGATLAMASFA
jgi:hypothetical protein